MKENLAQLSQNEMDKINIDLAAAGVAYKERYGIPVLAEAVEREQPATLREWFHERLAVHRISASKLDRLPADDE